jgi:hypothetical protein
MSWTFPTSPLSQFSAEDTVTLDLCRSLFDSLDLSVSDELLATVLIRVFLDLENCFRCSSEPLCCFTVHMLLFFFDSCYIFH